MCLQLEEEKKKNAVGAELKQKGAGLKEMLKCLIGLSENELVLVALML